MAELDILNANLGGYDIFTGLVWSWQNSLALIELFYYFLPFGFDLFHYYYTRNIMKLWRVWNRSSSTSNWAMTSRFIVEIHNLFQRKEYIILVTFGNNPHNTLKRKKINNNYTFPYFILLLYINPCLTWKHKNI